LNTALEESLRGIGWVDVARFGDDVELVEFTSLQFIQSRHSVEEASNLGFFDDALCQDAEFIDVLVTTKWTSTQRVGVGDGNFVFDDCAILQSDLDRPTEGLFVEIQRVVATGPFWIFDGRNFVPQFDGVWTLCAFWRIGIDVVPGAILE